jgi:hypothetical protein
LWQSKTKTDKPMNVTRLYADIEIVGSIGVGCSITYPVKPCIAYIQHDIDANHNYVGNIKPCGVGQYSSLQINPDLAKKTETVAQNYQNLKYDTFTLCGSGTKGLRNIKGPRGPENAKHNDLANLCDINHIKSLSFFYF